MHRYFALAIETCMDVFLAHDDSIISAIFSTSEQLHFMYERKLSWDPGVWLEFSCSRIAHVIEQWTHDFTQVIEYLGKRALFLSLLARFCNPEQRKSKLVHKNDLVSVEFIYYFFYRHWWYALCLKFLLGKM